jgi:L-alanine-DL-glutamate epimerase-like enolase superfamily enzyme
MATALVEMSLLEHDCRENSRVQTDVFAPCYDTPEIETVSLDDEVWPEIGTSRVRLKTSGEWRGEHREALSALANDVILDFNGAPLSTPEILATARAIAAQCSIHHLEQATAPGDWLASQQLREFSEFQIGIDEGLRHMGDLQACLRYRAASVICIKPPRVGGLAVAHDIFRRATSEGMTAYLGGFFDGPLARSWHRSLARATTAEASDIGPVDFEGPTGLVSDAGRWVLDDDISAYGELIFRGEFL